MSKIRALFLGTPDFSAKILKGLLEDEHYEIVGVVTQPDKPRGRELKLLPCPTKEVATQNRLTCLSPAKINALESIRAISDLRAEVAIVVAYGQILSVEFLNLFNFGAVNIHGSELPKWRGPAPVQRSIEAGETQTAVTLQKIVKELDAGDIIGIRFLTVNEQDSALDVLNKMTPLSLELLKIDLMDYIRGNLAPQPQNHKLATFAPKILKSETQIDWSLPATAIHNKVRAYLLGPGAWTQSPFGRIKILKTKVS
jgi:methionyl-tRNA formyltransferase